MHMSVLSEAAICAELPLFFNSCESIEVISSLKGSGKYHSILELLLKHSTFILIDELHIKGNLNC